MVFGAATLLASKHSTVHVNTRQGLASVGQHLRTSCVSPIHEQYPKSRVASSWSSQHVRTLATSSNACEDVLLQIKDFTAQYPLSVFQSRSNNPYHNLAIENHILKNSEPGSRVLFTYINRPCVVFGRNQNPWLECNISKLQEGLAWRAADWTSYNTVYDEGKGELTTKSDGTKVSLDLVRRRSGGGTVIHDAGNLNFSFIVPNDKNFTRDVHAQLVVEMLKKYKMSGQYLKETALFDDVKVNERHDIVMTPHSGDTSGEIFKASGSAFKLTRGRALHHGTLLLASPNLEHQKGADPMPTKSIFSTLLSSPAKPYLVAKGVGSVRSPVHNLFRPDEGLMKRRNLAVAIEDKLGLMFKKMYNDHDAPLVYVDDNDCHESVNKSIYNDVQEMMTDEWRFCQTPTFEYSSTQGDLKLEFQVKQGIIGRPSLLLKDDSPLDLGRLADLEGKKLHQIQCWDAFLPSKLKDQSLHIGDHLSEVFPAIRLSKAQPEHKSDNRIVHEGPVSKKQQGDQDSVKRRSPSGRTETERQGENLVVEK